MLTVLIVGGIAAFFGFLIKTFVYKQDPTKSLYGDPAPSITPNDERPATQANSETPENNDAPQLSVGICVLGAAVITIGLTALFFLIGQENIAKGIGAPAALVSYVTLRKGFSLFPRL